MLCRVLSQSAVSDSAAPWTAARQAPLSMGILQARILEWVAMPSSRDLPDPGMEPRSPKLQTDSLPFEPGFLTKVWLFFFFSLSILMSFWQLVS